MHTEIVITVLVHVVLLLFLGCGPAETGTFGSLEVTPAPETPRAEPPPPGTYVVPYLEASPSVNGELSDWRHLPSIALGKKDEAVHGRAWLGWGRDRFYLACEVTDPSFRNTGVGDTAGLEHCLIFDFDGWYGTGRSTAERMTFALTSRGVVTSWDILHRDDPGACVIRKTGADTYIYEIALSWHDVQPIAPLVSDRFGFDVLYQYLDVDGSRRCVRRQNLAGRNPARRRYGHAALAQPPGTLRGSHLYIGPKTYTVGEDGTIVVPVVIAAGKPIEGGTLVAEIATEDARSDARATGEGKIPLLAGARAFDVIWHADDAPSGTYVLRTTLKDASGKLLASDSFRAHKSPPLGIKTQYRELTPLYEKLKSSGSAIYDKDADSVDVRMETLARFANRKLNGVQAAQLERIAGNTREVLETMLAGTDYFTEARGWVVRGFRSPYDDTLQLYEVFVPKSYDASKKWPLIVHLHGAGGDDPLKMLDGTYTARYLPNPDWQHLQMMPFARGRAGYRGLGLTEVLDTIEYTKRLYNVDADRVGIKGFSMGGGGTWKIALQYPHVFAAANPRAGFVGYGLYDTLQKPGAERTWKTALAMSSAPMFLAENANNLPISVYHGGSDPTIPVENTYRMWERLRQLGGEHSLFVYHHRQHTWAKNLDPLQNADMLGCRRNLRPARVIYRTNHLHFRRAYWATVERLDDPLHMARIDCLKQSDGSVTVQADNIEAFSLELTPQLVPGKHVSITVNGSEVFTGDVPKDGEVFVEKTGPGGWRVVRRPKPSDPVKQPDLSGPVDDAFYGRVLYVYGTRAKDPELNKQLRELAEKRCGLNEPRRYTNRKRHGFYSLKADTEVTVDDMKHAHLVLIGGPAENLITTKIADRLPVKFAAGRFSLRGKTYAKASHGIKFIHPNPLSPGRYVIVTAANSVAGYRATTDLRRNIPDWAVTEGEYHTRGGNIVEAGFFNNRWE